MLHSTIKSIILSVVMLNVVAPHIEFFILWHHDIQHNSTQNNGLHLTMQYNDAQYTVIPYSFWVSPCCIEQLSPSCWVFLCWILWHYGPNSPFYDTMTFRIIALRIMDIIAPCSIMILSIIKCFICVSSFCYCEIKQQRRLFASADFYCEILSDRYKHRNGVL